MTKFHEDRAKIVDFLLIANFWASTIFFYPHFMYPCYVNFVKIEIKKCSFDSYTKEKFPLPHSAKKCLLVAQRRKWHKMWNICKLVTFLLFFQFYYFPHYLTCNYLFFIFFDMRMWRTIDFGSKHFSFHGKR